MPAIVVGIPRYTPTVVPLIPKYHSLLTNRKNTAIVAAKSARNEINVAMTPRVRCRLV